MIKGRTRPRTKTKTMKRTRTSTRTRTRTRTRKSNLFCCSPLFLLPQLWSLSLLSWLFPLGLGREGGEEAAGRVVGDNKYRNNGGDNKTDGYFGEFLMNRTHSLKSASNAPPLHFTQD